MTMPMDRLRTQSLRDFMEAEADPGAFCLFLHIPKTAGSSLGHELAAVLTPYRNISLDYLDESVPHGAKRQKAVETLIAELERDGGLRSASGHITMRQALQVKRAHPRTRIVTFLRDPVRRVISDYRYQRTPAHPMHEAFIREYPTIEDYVRAAPSQNKMFKRLVKRPAQDVGVGIDRIARTVSFVGLVENYAMSVDILFRLFGADVAPSVHLRRTQDMRGNQVEVTPDLTGLILDLNRSDAALYGHFKSLLRRHEAEWESLRRGGLPAGDEARRRPDVARTA
jgi:hypothetical protein